MNKSKKRKTLLDRMKYNKLHPKLIKLNGKVIARRCTSIESKKTVLDYKKLIKGEL